MLFRSVQRTIASFNHRPIGYSCAARAISLEAAHESARSIVQELLAVEFGLSIACRPIEFASDEFIEQLGDGSPTDARGILQPRFRRAGQPPPIDLGFGRHALQRNPARPARLVPREALTR